MEKAELNGRKVMLYVWWDHCSIMHFTFLNHNQTLNADLYSQHLYENLLRKHPTLIKKGKVVLVHDNAWSYSARITQEKIFHLG